MPTNFKHLCLLFFFHEGLSCNSGDLFVPLNQVHTLTSTWFIKSECFPYLLSITAVLYINTSSLFFSYIASSLFYLISTSIALRESGKRGPMTRKRSHSCLCLSQNASCWCTAKKKMYISKRVAIPLVLVPLLLEVCWDYFFFFEVGGGGREQ